MRSGGVVGTRDGNERGWKRGAAALKDQDQSGLEGTVNAVPAMSTVWTAERASDERGCRAGWCFSVSVSAIMPCSSRVSSRRMSCGSARSARCGWPGSASGRAIWRQHDSQRGNHVHSAPKVAPALELSKTHGSLRSTFVASRGRARGPPHVGKAAIVEGFSHGLRLARRMRHPLQRETVERLLFCSGARGHAV